MTRNLTRLAGLCSLAVILPVSPALAGPPPELAAALQYLREQHSYSWEVINGDPGPVEQDIETARGPIKTVIHNASPHLKGRLSASGEMLIERDWPDGLTLQTLVAADGAQVTNTPAGWLSQREILEAIAAERLRPDGPSASGPWLPLAEAVNTRRPAEELEPFLDPRAEFEKSGETYICTIPIMAEGPAAVRDESQAIGRVIVSLHVVGGVLRDYELKREIARYVTRAKIPIVANSDQIVILSYLPVGRIDVPEEARAKLKPGRGNPRG